MNEVENLNEHEPLVKRFYISTDEQGVVKQCQSTNMQIPEMTEISQDDFDRLMPSPGLFKYLGGVFSDYAPPPLPPAIPAIVTDYQFAGQAEAEGIITFEEALAWTARGDIPKVLLDAVNEAVPDQERRKSVLLFLAGSKEYPRNHPLTPVLGSLLGKNDDAALDAFWVAASAR